MGAVEFTKGFLYKIKNDENQTVGYLFGTIHNLDLERLSALHPKIFKSLDKCKSIFFEFHIRSEAGLKEHEKLLAYYKLIEFEITKTEEPSLEGVDDALTAYATKINLPINSLETAESRIKAEMEVRGDREHLQVKCLGILGIAIQVAWKKITNFYDITKPSDPPDVWLGIYMDAYNSLIDAAKILYVCDKRRYNIHEYMHCDMGNSELYQIDSSFKFLIEKHKVVLLMLEDKGLELLTNFLNLRTNLLRESVGQSKSRRKVDGECYIKGDKEERLTLYDSFESLVNEKEEEIRRKQAFFRDEFMFGRMQESLEKSDKKNRHFYAVGSKHLLAKYDNLSVRVQRAGWKIIDAYTPQNP